MSISAPTVYIADYLHLSGDGGRDATADDPGATSCSSVHQHSTKPIIYTWLATSAGTRRLTTPEQQASHQYTNILQKLIIYTCLAPASGRNRLSIACCKYADISTMVSSPRPPYSLPTNHCHLAIGKQLISLPTSDIADFLDLFGDGGRDATDTLAYTY